MMEMSGGQGDNDPNLLKFVVFLSVNFLIQVHLYGHHNVLLHNMPNFPTCPRRAPNDEYFIFVIGGRGRRIPENRFNES